MADVPALIQHAIIGALSRIPKTQEPYGTSPVTRAHAIARVAALKAATVSGSLSLPPGPVGWLTVIPDLTMVWKIQSQMVADIAGAFGKQSFLGQEQMVYCLFRHAAAHTVRGLIVRASERILIGKAPAHTVAIALRRIGARVARRIAARGMSRWLPVVGAVGVAGYAYYDTMRVAATTIDLFRSELVDARSIVAVPILEPIALSTN
jgi:hypothetical protein